MLGYAKRGQRMCRANAEILRFTYVIKLMNRSKGGLFILFLLIHVSLWPKAVELEVETRTTGRIGYTNYELKDRDEYGDTVYSLLEFPLNTFYLGASTRLTLESANKREFELIVGTIVNLNDPNTVMKDSDWIQFFGYPKLKFSYTESRVELNAFEIAFEGRMRIFPNSGRKLYATGGYRYLRYAENVIGYEGWYIDPDTGQVSDYPPNQDDLAIEYRINYHTPYMGLLWRWSKSSRFSFELGADLALAFVSDYDDHVLRGKLSTASGAGIGLHAVSGISFFPFGRNRVRSTYIRVMVETNYLAANIKQTQEWYRDEGSIPAGTIIRGIGHEIRSLQVGAELLVGMKLKL